MLRNSRVRRRNPRVLTKRPKLDTKSKSRLFKINSTLFLSNSKKLNPMLMSLNKSTSKEEPNGATPKIN
jgi:hypothetical protein